MMARAAATATYAGEVLPVASGNELLHLACCMAVPNIPNCLMLEVENTWIFLEIGDLDYEMAAIASGQFEVLVALARQHHGCALDAVLFSGNPEGVDRLESRDARKGNRHQEISGSYFWPASVPMASPPSAT